MKSKKLNKSNTKSIDKLVDTMAKLRSPKGCPWDKIQTHKTLKRYLIEEAYETIDAIDTNDPKLLMEELGDVLLQVVLHSQIAKEKRHFTFNDVATCVNEKMITRHPHVFSNVKVKNAEEVIVNWEKIKRGEKPHRKDVLDGVPRSLPALLRAFKISKKVARDGFDWEKEIDIWKVLNSEIKEFNKALKSKKKGLMDEELGDILFTIVNIARWHKIDPEESLSKSTFKFVKRYNDVKGFAKKANKNLNELSAQELNKIWELVKNKRKR